MRKLSLLVCSSLVLLGAFGAMAQTAAASDPEPDCSGRPNGVQGFHALTVPSTGGAIADLYGGAALCGTDVHGLFNDFYGGYTMGYILTAGDMDAKNGPTIRCANPYGDSRHRAYCSGTDLAEKRFVGTAYTDQEVCTLNSLCYRNPTHSDMYVGDAGTLNGRVRDSRCKNVATAVQCFQSKDWTGLGTTDVVVQPCWAVTPCRTAKAPTIPNLDPYEDRYFMTIYQVDALLGNNVYYMEIGKAKYTHPSSDPDPDDLRICARAGAVNGTSCGTDDADWVQKNPPTGAYACSGTKPEGFAVRPVTTGNLPAQPDVCYPYTWT